MCMLNETIFATIDFMHIPEHSSAEEDSESVWEPEYKQ